MLQPKVIAKRPTENLRCLGCIACVAMPRAPVQRRGTRARSRSRSGRGPTRWRPDRQRAQPVRIGLAGYFAGSMDAPRARPSSPAVQPPLATERRCRNAPGSLASRCRTAAATSSPTSLVRSCRAPCSRRDPSECSASIRSSCPASDVSSSHALVRGRAPRTWGLRTLQGLADALGGLLDALDDLPRPFGRGGGGRPCLGRSGDRHFR
jgi:hypothetical protein